MKVKKILVSQPKPTGDKSPYFDIAAKHKVEIVFRPFIKVEGLTVKEFRQQKINLAEFTAVIFTARHAVDHFFRLCEESRVSVPDTMKYFCTTESIALYLQKYIVYRKRKIFFGKSGKLNDPSLLAAMTKNNKEKFLLPVSDVHKEEFKILSENHIDFTVAVMYRTVSNDFGKDEKFDYDMLLFFSPSGISSLLKNFPDFDQKKNGIIIGTFGATTAKAVTDAGLELGFSAPTPETPSMSGALDKYLSDKSK
ncbi:MAG: uroporphyrinogen-III synthase [Bacteroidales bacterium]|nr:uroporphyrinogen-III synthase [Bacteroidales bacterium]MBD5190664.1 uroporphyrinogen-III synthase [Bacteroidales bacterium]MBD5208990.1 uroporphyrinogen-III synthase [Bacteroidales bacterium]